MVSWLITVVTAERVTLEPAADTLSALGIVLDEVELTVPFAARDAEELKAVVVAAPETVNELALDLEPTGFDVAGMLDKLAGPVVVAAYVVAELASTLGALELKDKEDDTAVGGIVAPPPFVVTEEGTLLANSGEDWFVPTIPGLERSTRTMTAHAIPSSAFNTGLSGNLNIFLSPVCVRLEVVQMG